MQEDHVQDRYLIGTYLIRVDTPEDVVQIYRGLASQEDAAKAEAAARHSAPSNFGDFQCHIKDRLEKIVCWHLDRGEARDLKRGDGWSGLNALDNLLDAVGELPTSHLDFDDDEIDDLIASAEEARVNASCGSEWDMQHDNPDFGPAFYQCKEIQESDIGELLMSFRWLEEIRRQERDGELSPAEAWMSVAEIMMEAPARPAKISDAPVVRVRGSKSWH